MPRVIKKPESSASIPSSSILTSIYLTPYNCADRKGEPGYENRFRSRPISGGRDLSCYGVERLPQLHSPSASRRLCWTVHGRALCVALPVGDFRVSGYRGCTTTGQPLRTFGGGRPGADNCQHSYFPRFDGPERASTGPLCGCTVGADLRRRETSLWRVVPVATGSIKQKIEEFDERPRQSQLTLVQRKENIMKTDRTILITGVTGNQGGAVANALKGTRFQLRGLTRKPDSEQATALARDGVDVFKGDLDDAETLRRALADTWGVFSVQNTLEAGVQRG